MQVLLLLFLQGHVGVDGVGVNGVQNAVLLLQALKQALPSQILILM